MTVGQFKKQLPAPRWGKTLLAAFFLFAAFMAMSVIIGKTRSTAGDSLNYAKMQEAGDFALAAERLLENAILNPTDNNALSRIGISGPLKLDGSSVPFRGEIDGAVFSGTVNCPGIPDSIDIKSFGYNQQTEEVSHKPADLPLPANHGRIIYQVEKDKIILGKYCLIISYNSPFGVVADNGEIRLNNAISAADTNDGLLKFKDGGLKYHMVSKTAPRFFGSPRGIIPAPAQRENFIDTAVSRLFTDVNRFEKAIGENSTDPGFRQFAGFLYKAVKLFNGYEVMDTSDYIWDGKTLTWGGSLVIPENSSVRIPFGIRVAGNLVLNDNSTLSAEGDITVKGTAVIGKNASLHSGGRLNVANSVTTTYGNREVRGIGSFVGAKGDITIKNGLRRIESFEGTGGEPFSFKPIPSPYPEKIPFFRGGRQYFRNNPLYAAFSKKQKAIVGLFQSRFAGFSLYNAKAEIQNLPAVETQGVPGLLLASSEGGVRIEENHPDGQWAGLICAKLNITLDYPGEGRGTFTGILISRKGRIDAPNVTYRYYPFYSYTRLNQGKGKSLLIKSLVQPRIVYRGECP